MAKIVIAGDAVVITSALKLEDLRTVAKYRPKSLILMGGEDGKEPIFRVAVSHGAGDINQYGIEFGRETRDDAKLATLTMVTTGIGEDIKEFIVDKIGGALVKLNKLEEILPAVIDEINTEKAAVLESITIAQ